MKELSKKTLDRLDSIKGKTFMYNTNQLLVHAYKVNGMKVQIVTDKGWYEPSYDQIEKFLDDLLPVETPEESGAVAEKGQLIVNQAQVTSSGIRDLKTILMDNIKKVQESKEYIPQAQEINNNVKSIIEVAKAEIEVLKIIKG